MVVKPPRDQVLVHMPIDQQDTKTVIATKALQGMVQITEAANPEQSQVKHAKHGMQIVVHKQLIQPKLLHLLVQINPTIIAATQMVSPKFGVTRQTQQQ